MNPKTLPYGLRPHEIGYLILLAAAFYYSDEKFRGSPCQLWLFGAAVLAGVGVLAGRCRINYFLASWLRRGWRCSHFWAIPIWAMSTRLRCSLG